MASSNSQEARIRPLTAADEKLARFTIAKSCMEGLASANVKTMTHPLTLALWAAISWAVVRYMGWIPSADSPWFAYLTPIPAVMAVAAPIMAGSDWFTRPQFDDLTTETMRELHTTVDFYAQPGCGAWVLEYGKTFVGLVAIAPVTLLNTSDSGSEGKNGARKKTKLRGTDADADCARITHLFVDEPFRTARAQEDLLQYALEFAFADSSAASKSTSAKSASKKSSQSTSAPTPTYNSVVCNASPLRSYVGQALDAFSFDKGKEVRKEGMFGWKVVERRVERRVWEKVAAGSS